MSVYVDSSVLLRVVLGEVGQLEGWEAVKAPVTSALTEVECYRTLDRLHLRRALRLDQVLDLRRAVSELLQAFETVELTRPILSRAGQPLPAPLGTLDALHLVTALTWREVTGGALGLATHDAALGVAARASGFEVVGC